MNPHASLLAVVLLSSPVFSQGTTPRWVLDTVSGERLSGVVRLEPGASAMRVIGDDGERTVGLDELQRMEQPGADPLRPVGRRQRIWLRSGVELPMSNFSGTGREFLVGVPFASERLSLALPYIAALRLADQERDSDFEDQLAEPGEATDYLYLLDEDRTTRISARVTGFESDHLRIELGGREREVPWDRLYGVIFGRDSGAAPDRQPRPRASIELWADVHLEGRLVSLGESVELRLDEGQTLRIGAVRVAAIGFATDRLVYLSDLQPSHEEQTPALDRVWPWLRDRSPAGAPILLGGRSFDKGLVLFPHTRLSWDLEGEYDLFEAVIGIEDRGGPQAHAVFRILGDDEILFESEPFVLGKEPQALRIPVGSVRQLTLEADFGKNLDLGDHCVFADARVVRS